MRVGQDPLGVPHGVGEMVSAVGLGHGYRLEPRAHVACEQSDTANASFVGFHVEGPYIASEDGPRGAHPLVHTRDPDWDEFCRYQEAAGGRIRIVTLAPRAGRIP